MHTKTITIASAFAALGAAVACMAGEETAPAAHDMVVWTVFTPGIFAATAVLLCCSAFFSASEVAFYSLHRLQLRTMQGSSLWPDRLAAYLMAQPADLLASILMGNCIVNVLFGIVFASKVEILFARLLPLPSIVSYILAVILSTGLLVIFGEMTPKLIAVRKGVAFARLAAAPIWVLDRTLMPVRKAVLALIAFFLRVTRVIEVRPAPFLTDDEFKSLLSEGETSGAIEENERQMIQGIIEFGDATVREILVPRPDMIAIKEEATIGEALETVREHEFSRMPVYRGDLDHITGVLHAKDLLPPMDSGEWDAPIKPLVRRAYFVPQTMRLGEFLRMTQRGNAHLAIVVDEYGGTNGLVTLQDALREVVGDIGEEDDTEKWYCEESAPGVYRIEGNFPIDELEKLTGHELDDGEHTTLAGFLMEKTEKLLEAGDVIEYEGIRYEVLDVVDKRVAMVRMSVMGAATDEQERAS